jgi:hypothetical protein
VYVFVFSERSQFFYKNKKIEGRHVHVGISRTSMSQTIGGAATMTGPNHKADAAIVSCYTSSAKRSPSSGGILLI